MDDRQRTPLLGGQRIARETWRAAASYRLVLLLALVLLGLALLLTVEWKSYTLHLTPFQSPLTVTISLVWPVIGLLTAGMALGAAGIFQYHPATRSQPAAGLVALWPLPALTVSLAALLLQEVMPGELWAGGIAATGALLYAIFRLEYRLMDRPAGKSPWSEWAIQILAYLAALAYFVLICRTRLRTLLSAPGVLTVGGLLAMRLLHGVASDWRKENACALAIGLTLGQATWAVNYWPWPSTVGGVLLSLLFYVFVGLARRSLQSRLTRWALLEYGVVTLLGLGLLIRFG